MNSASLAVPGVILALAILLAALFALGFFSSTNHFPIEGRTVIITGGSQGLGLSIANQLAAKGASIVIVARDTTKLKVAIAEIKSHAKTPHTQRFHHLSYDLCSPSSAPEILATVTKWNNNTPPEILFCCAGYTVPGFFASSSLETLRGQMDTIYWSCAHMAHAALNTWLSEKQAVSPRRHHIIFTSSVLAFFPLAGYATYSPAKAAMRALGDTLVQEAAVYNGAGADINVHTLFPMGILTPGLANENKTKPALTLKLEEADKPQSADEVAAITIRRLEAGDSMITTMFVGHLMRGCALGGSVLNHGVVDLFWRFLGSIVILFVVPDFMGKCRRWGREKGLAAAAK